MKNLVVSALIVLCLQGCSPRSSGPATAEVAIPVVAEVLVTRSGQVWTADYHFLRSSPAWVFEHSAVTQAGAAPWRPGRWTVETTGVRLERHGRYDTLVAEGRAAVPTRVRIRFQPYSGGLVADYDPTLTLGESAVALFSDQFDVFPVGSTGEAAALPLDLGMARIAERGTRATFRDRSGPVFSQGVRRPSISLVNGRTYVLFGSAQVIETPDIATIVDPGLPEWLRREIAELTPKILATYSARLGPRSGARPMAMVSWRGPTPGQRSMGGSVLPGLVIMSFQGDGVAVRNAVTEETGRWFLAHESAHFWLGETVRHEFAQDAWISEGGADLLAMRAIAVIDPAYVARPRLASSLDDCIRLAAGKPLATAAERNENRAYYACGAIFGLIAEAVAKKASKGDFFTFWRGLIDANRGDGVVTKDEWLSELDRLTGDAGVVKDIRAMIETGVPDPPATFAALFDRTGIAYTRAPGGKLTLL